MNFLLINSNNTSSFVASIIDGNICVKYTNDFLDHNEKNAYLKSPDKLVHCLKYITDKISEERKSPSIIDAVSIIIGPGSFTGIRVGLSLAKGFADSLEKKLIPIDNFELILNQLEIPIDKEKYCILIQAKFPEYYYSLYQNDTIIERGCLPIEELRLKTDKNTVIAGNFSDDYIKKLGYFTILEEGNRKSELDSMLIISENKFNKGNLFESELIEPLYIKEFSYKKLK